MKCTFVSKNLQQKNAQRKLVQKLLYKYSILDLNSTDYFGVLFKNVAYLRDLKKIVDKNSPFD